MASQYCQPSDLVLTGINPLALQDISPSQQTTACLQASEVMDSRGFRGRYGNNSPILLAWGQDVTYQAAQIAVYLLLKARGYNPDAGADDNIRKGYDDALEWCSGVERQNIHPDVTPNVQLGINAGPDLPQVQTSPQRGWLTCNSNGRPSVGW